MSRSSPSFKSVFDRMGQAAQTAAGNYGRLLGQSPNRDVAFYETLTPDDFDRMGKQHGSEAVIEYITTMEARRLRREG